MRKFEKVSFEQFKNDIVDDRKLYEEYNLPRRKTKSIGYLLWFQRLTQTPLGR